MTRRLAHGVALVLMGAVGCGGPSPRERALVEHWLLCDECTAGERDSVVRLRDRAVSPLGDALEGPSRAQLRNVRRQVEASYARLVTAAAAAGDSPSVARTIYVDHYVGNFTAVYESRAAIALGLIGTPQALDELRQALERPPGYYRGDVRRAIATALGTTISIAAGQNQTATAGTPVLIDPSVVVREASGIPVRGVSVRFRPVPGGGAVTDSIRTTDDSGRATVGAWTLRATAGPDTLRALVPGDTALFTATATSSVAFLTIIAGSSQTVPAGTAVPVGLAVLATDSNGNPAPGTPVTFTVTLGGGSVTGGSATTGGNGIAQVGSWTLGPAPGLNRLRASALARPDVTIDATGTLAPADLDGGSFFTCVRTVVGAAYCWGFNQFGRLGDGSTTTRLKPAPVVGGLSFAEVSTGTAHVCALTPGNVAYCWGFNTFGGLGDSTTTHRSLPVPVKGGLTFTQVSSGGAHSCGLTAAGTAYCWGYNGFGQLGDSTSTDRPTPVPVDGGLAFSAVSAGGAHTCAITTNGAAYCWGMNNLGQIGDSTTTNRVRPVAVKGGLVFSAISAGGNYTCGITTSNVAYCWGQNETGQLGDGSVANRRTPVRVSGGLVFASVNTGDAPTAAFPATTCGLTPTGKAYCWGHNRFGQVGDGTTTSRRTPRAVAGGLVFAAISTMATHTCGVTTSRSTYCWGRNNWGELGNGTVLQRLVPTRVAEP